MGRHDSYTYFSEAGQAASGDVPGEEHESVREQNERVCQECDERKPSVVERKGDLEGEVLCEECAKERQREIEEEQKKAVLDAIHSDEDE